MTYSQSNLIKELPRLFESLEGGWMSSYDKKFVTTNGGEGGALRLYITLSKAGFNTVNYFVEITNTGDIYNTTIPLDMLNYVFKWLKTFSYCQKRITSRVKIFKMELIQKVLSRYKG